MDDFANILQRDYGLKPQGKAAPLSSARGLGLGSSGDDGGRKEAGAGRGNRNGNRVSLLDGLAEDFGEDLFLGGSDGGVKPPTRTNLEDPFVLSSTSGYDDVFGGPPKYSSPQFATLSGHDDIFRAPSKNLPNNFKTSNSPLFDTPVYDDDDIFGGVPGTRSSAGVFDDVFGGNQAASSSFPFEDLLAGYSAADRKPKASSAGSGSRGSVPVHPPSAFDRDSSVFDNLLSGGGTVESKPSWSSEVKPSQDAESEPAFATVGSSDGTSGYVDPIISILHNSAPSPLTGDSMEGHFDWGGDRASGSGAGLSESDGFLKPTHSTYFPTSLRPVKDGRRKDGRHKDTGLTSDSSRTDVFGVPFFGAEPPSGSVETVYPSNDVLPKDGGSTSDFKMEEIFVKSFPGFDPPSASAETVDASNFLYNDKGFASDFKIDQVFEVPLSGANLPSASVQADSVEVPAEIWVTVDQVELVTLPSTVPPPMRAPPPSRDNGGPSFWPQDVLESHNRRPGIKGEMSWEGASEGTQWSGQKSAYSSLAPDVADDVMAAAAAIGIEGLEEFVSGILHNSGGRNTPVEGTGPDGSGSAAVETGVGGRGEVKFRMAKEAREKDRDDQQREAIIARALARDREERSAREQVLREAKEKQEREKESREEIERVMQRKERWKEREREREKDRAAERLAVERLAVERAAAEARERAAAEARGRAERAAFERAAAEARERAAAEAKERADKVAAEAKERSEKAAAEARDRAAAEARGRAERSAVERATAEARERAATEARERAERAAVERVTAEARERAAAEARTRAAERAAADRAEARARAERAAAESAAAEARERAERTAAERSREQQRRSDNEFDRLFNTRANSEPRQRPPSADNPSDQRHSQGLGTGRPPPSSTGGVRKVASSANITDDWTMLFTASGQDEFQEIEGEPPERRKARWDRHQRTVERTTKALADKNQRDLDMQMEQVEKERAAEVLDSEIKRWAAGKEGNLRALLSTLQYVLWPECGWQPISLTDIISGIAVKKAYRKATLCVHPDKVQQKGATVQQKYIAEKVFDLLKESWNKFNSEELF